MPAAWPCLMPQSLSKAGRGKSTRNRIVRAPKARVNGHRARAAASAAPAGAAAPRSRGFARGLGCAGAPCRVGSSAGRATAAAPRAPRRSPSRCAPSPAQRRACGHRSCTGATSSTRVSRPAPPPVACVFHKHIDSARTQVREQQRGIVTCSELTVCRRSRSARRGDSAEPTLGPSRIARDGIRHAPAPGGQAPGIGLSVCARV